MPPSAQELGNMKKPLAAPPLIKGNQAQNACEAALHPIAKRNSVFLRKSDTLINRQKKIRKIFLATKKPSFSQTIE
jgi:ABC-type uncharacterized transport system YnjBCD ATPase subunit